MLIFILFGVPILSVLWFLNLITFLKNLKESRDYRNQKILGAVYTFFIVFPLIFILVELLY